VDVHVRDLAGRAGDVKRYVVTFVPRDSNDNRVRGIVVWAEDEDRARIEAKKKLREGSGKFPQQMVWVSTSEVGHEWTGKLE
jgi:hypothetical protein